MPRFTGRYQLACALLAVAVLAGCSESDAPDDKLNPVEATHDIRVLPAGEALAGAQRAKLDPESMSDAEIRKVLGDGPHCAFRYTSSGRPVLGVKVAGGAAEGVVKVNGILISLKAAADTDSLLLADDPVRMSVALDEGTIFQAGTIPQQDATSVFEIGNSLRAGYRGYYKCPD
jgi:hypothetical protein